MFGGGHWMARGLGGGMDSGCWLIWYGCAGGWRKGQVSVDCRQSEAGQATLPEGKFRSVSAGGQHTCGIRVDDTISCWVFDSSGEVNMLGAPPGKFVSVTVEDNLACGVSEAGDATCWALLSGCQVSSDGSGCTPDANLKHVELTEENYRRYLSLTASPCAVLP